MRKALILLALLLAFTSIGLGQGSGPITVKEVDGSPVCNNCRTFVFPNGSLTVSGNKVTVATGGGGGSGITIGTTTVTSGTNTRVLFNDGGVVGEYAVTGTGNAVLSTSPTITTPAITTSQTTTRDAIGVTSTDGIVLQNTTAAALGAQQYSPRLHWIGQGFATTPAASRTVEWVAEIQPVQQTSGPANRLVFKGQVNGTGFADILALSYDPNINGNRVGISNGLVLGSTAEADMSEFQLRVRGSGGAANSSLTSTTLNLPAAGNILWANTTDGWNGTKDLTLRRLTTASIVQGAANNATPVANFFTIGESSRGGTDSNVAGANGTVQSGLGTGTGALSTLILRSPIAAASGTTAQTYATGLTVVGGTAKMTSYTVAALPAAATVGAGARAFVTDALTPVFGSAVTGGGAVGVPVYSDGSTWLVG